MFNIIKQLPFDKEVTVYSEKSIDVYLLRPSVLSKRFKGYDINKNFQIWLKEGKREFSVTSNQQCNIFGNYECSIFGK